MPIDSLRDGFVRMCFDPSLNTFAGKCRLLVEGQYYDPEEDCDTVPDVLTKVTSVRDVDCRFGEGSVLAEGLKEIFSCCGNNAVDVYALPRLDADGAVAAEYEITITGNATSSGRIDLYWGEGDWNISIFIASGLTPTLIGDAIVAAAPDGFPFTMTNLAGVITLVARNAGTVNNNLSFQYNWHDRSNYAPAGVTVEFASSVVGSGNPEPLDYETVLGECCYCCIAMLYDDVTWQDGMIAYIAEAWSCLKPQCFGHGYTYNTGSLGTILATGTNSAEVSRMAQCTSDPILGWLKVAAYASISCCATVDNPELSVQGPTFGVLTCLSHPESCTQCFSYDEQVQLKDAGFVVTVPLMGGSGALTSPQIANDVTNFLFDEEGRPNATFKDVNSRRLAAKTADELAKFLQQFNALGLFTKNTDIKPGVRGTNPRLMLGKTRSWAKDNVGVLFSEFDNIDKDITLLTDFQVAPSCQGKPGKLYLNLVYSPPVRVGEVEVNMQPRLLSNC